MIFDITETFRINAGPIPANKLAGYARNAAINILRLGLQSAAKA